MRASRLRPGYTPASGRNYAATIAPMLFCNCVLDFRLALIHARLRASHVYCTHYPLNSRKFTSAPMTAYLDGASMLPRTSAPGGQVVAKVLLWSSRSPGTLHESLDFFEGEAAIFVRVHRFKDTLVGRLKLLQRDGP